MNTKERTVKKALRRVESFIRRFYLIDQEQYEKLRSFLNSNKLPERENKLIMSYCEEFLNPAKNIFESCKCPDISEYSRDLDGNDHYTIVAGQEDEFLSRLESTYLNVIKNFVILQKTCACSL